jgi:hypothetical protein
MKRERDRELVLAFARRNRVALVDMEGTMKNRLTEITRVRFSADELGRVRACAACNNRSVSNQVRAIVLDFLDQQAEAERDGRELMDRLDEVVGPVTRRAAMVSK